MGKLSQELLKIVHHAEQWKSNPLQYSIGGGGLNGMTAECDCLELKSLCSTSVVINCHFRYHVVILFDECGSSSLISTINISGWLERNICQVCKRLHHKVLFISTVLE